MKIDEFFIFASHWLSFSTWKEMIEERNRWLADIKRDVKKLNVRKLMHFCTEDLLEEVRVYRIKKNYFSIKGK